VQQDAQEFLKLLLTYLDDKLVSCDSLPDKISRSLFENKQVLN